MSTEERDVSDYRVVILRDGFLEHEDGLVKKACTVSLVLGAKKVLVETGAAWDRQWLVEALRQQGGISPDEVDYVVCTHCRSELVGNLNLFPNATHIVGCEVQPASGRGSEYLCHDFADPFEIDNFVRVTATPGRTADGVSVLVKGTPDGTVALTGGLFGSEDDFEQPYRWMEWSQDEDVQLHSRDRVLAEADHIVPGHGAMFRVLPKFLRTPSIQEVDDE